MTTKTRKVANSGSNIIETISSGPVAGFRNAIINGNFDYWQRGSSLGSAAGARFLADRWANFSVGTTYTASVQTFTLGQTDVPYEPKNFHRTVVSTVAGAANYYQLVQRIEGVRTFAGQTCTISFYAKADASKPIALELIQIFGFSGSPSNAVILYVGNPPLTTSWVKYTYTVTIPSISGKTLGTDTADSVQLSFWFDAGSSFNSRTNTMGQQSGTFDIAQVQVEPGTQATPFEQRPLATELELCQRYYEKSYSTGVNGAAPGTITDLGVMTRYIDGLANGGHTGVIPFRFAVLKRVSPTMTYYSPITGAANVIWSSSTSQDLGVAGSQVGTGGGRVWHNPSSTTTAVNAQAQFTAEAEL